MTNEELIRALRCCGNINTDCTVCPWDKYNFGMCAEKLYTDAAAAIEELDAEETRLLLLTSELQDKLMDLQAEVQELKRVNMELFDDLPKYGDKILHWVRCEEALPEIGQRVIVYDGWMQFMTRKDDQLFDGKMYWENEEGNWERVDDEAYWMPIEPPQEVQDADR